MHNKDKSGANNPQYGVIKSPETIAKLSKLVSVYNEVDNTLIGQYPTVVCKTRFNIGYDTLIQCIKSGRTYKGYLFIRESKTASKVK